MWPGGSPARSPVHPSPGFLLKCGKEHEKLQLRLRSQLQRHMLSVLEDGLFADVTIESGGSVLRAHKAVLVVRVPAFWRLLTESFATTGTCHFAVPLDEDRLGDFLRSVYSDDDIRMKEHDILRALRSQDAPSTDEDDDGGHFQGTSGGPSGICAPSASVPDNSGTDGPLIGPPLGPTEDSLENLCLVNDGGGTVVSGTGEEPLDSLCDHGGFPVCDDGSVSMSSSMVRSGTFDLQSQMPLEEAIDKCPGKEEEPAPPMAAFFLHDKSSAPVPVSYLPRQPSGMNDSGFLSQNTSVVNEASLGRPSGALFPFYIDMSQAADEGGSRAGPDEGPRPMPRTLSLSMFIDIHDEHSESVVCAQEAYSRSHPAEDHRMWERFEREEILVVSEELSSTADLCLLPMSPILRRKAQPPNGRTRAPVKASTRPQDIDAMTFRRPRGGGEDSDSLEHESDTGPPAGDSALGSPQPAEVSAEEPPAATAKRPKMPAPSSPRGDREDDSETVYSEVSEVSGLSSVDQRMHDSETAGGACSKLGDDLLRMFRGQVETDVVICVEGKRIGAHRFVLASRSDYFSLILREEFAAEEEEEFISMDGFTHGAVLFALQHLYGGTATPPRGVHVSELALLAEVLGVDSLRQVVLSHVRAYYCHFFHKPCGQCIAGLSECLQMAACCSELRELQARAVQWAGRHYVRVWPHRAFATVPDHWQQQCYEATLQALTAETAIEMALNCERLSVTLPRVRWAESALSLANRLLHDCTGLMSREFDRVLRSKGFLDLGKGQSWNVTALEDTLLTAAEGLSPDAACLSCIALDQLLPESQQRATQNFVELLRKIQRQCERFLIHNANRVVHCQSWSSLSPELQKKIRDAAVIVFEFEKPIAPPPRLSSLRRPRRRSAGGLTTEAGDASQKGSPPRRGLSSPKTSGSDSSELHGPAAPGAARPRGSSSQGLPAEGTAAASLVVDSRAALPAAMSASIESCRESSSDSGKEQVRPEKKTRNSRISRGASPKVPRDLGARPKSAATWAHGPPGLPLTVWANPQSRPPTQYSQSLRQAPSSTGDSHRCSGQVVRVPPFTIKRDAPPGTASNNNSRGADQACDNSPVATGEPSPDASPDFVAEIDAESNLVSHCLQEAELLERELSRKLRKQKRDPYTRPPALRPPPLHRRRPTTDRTAAAAATAAPLHGPTARSPAAAARPPSTGVAGRRAASSESRPPQRASGIAVSTKPASRR